MTYNWQHPHWPNFEYRSEEFQSLLYEYAQQVGRFSTGLSYSSEEDQLEAQLDLMVQEAINSSRIEGELIDPLDVRSSLRNYLGLSQPHIRIADSRAEGIAALMLQTRKDINEPLSNEMILHWHILMLSNQPDSLMHKPINVGQWRTSAEPMQIVSGPVGYERVHYQAPPSEDITQEMQQLIDWVNRNQSLPAPIKAGIAHLWFESIHPFDDGNGRIGRALAEYCLGQDSGHNILLSLSATIEQQRKEYYQQLHQASIVEQDDVLDISAWLNWFCNAVLTAQKDAAISIQFIMGKTKFWQTHQNTELNDRQQQVLQKLFSAGYKGFEQGVNAQKYAALGKCSKATATRDLADLVIKMCLQPIQSKGRNARYELCLEVVI